MPLLVAFSFIFIDPPRKDRELIAESPFCWQGRNLRALRNTFIDDSCLSVIRFLCLFRCVLWNTLRYFLLSLIAFPLLLIALSYVAPLVPQRPRCYSNAIIPHSLLAVAVTYSLIFSICERALGGDSPFGLLSALHHFALMMVQMTGIKVAIKGWEHLQGRPIIIAMNHQTWVGEIISSFQI